MKLLCSLGCTHGKLRKEAGSSTQTAIAKVKVRSCLCHAAALSGCPGTQGFHLEDYFLDKGSLFWKADKGLTSDDVTLADACAFSKCPIGGAYVPELKGNFFATENFYYTSEVSAYQQLLLEIHPRWLTKVKRSTRHC